MFNHHIHSAIAEQRTADLRGAARRDPKSSSWAELAPVVNLLAGFSALLVLAWPSL